MGTVAGSGVERRDSRLCACVALGRRCVRDWAVTVDTIIRIAIAAAAASAALIATYCLAPVLGRSPAAGKPRPDPPDENQMPASL